ncbi:phosphomevalonate kinase [Coemansia sp. Benny D115]|nr:phosphomevalonate kinase [Coemansia sp. Benny D115]
MTYSSAQMPITLASAPGKVLVAGGYLVLDRKHSGLVVGTDACLYAAVQTQALTLALPSSGSTSGAATQEPLGPRSLAIRVESPQFKAAWWEYVFDCELDALKQHASADNGTNGFVQVVLGAVLGLVNQLAPAKINELLQAPAEAGRSGLKIVLSADNDFYSQRATLEAMGLPLTSEALRQLPRMCETGTTLGAVHKTGLGSSAAMVTSLVAAILAHFGLVGHAELQPEAAGTAEGKRCRQLIHNVAQFTHCLAQGKVGSGFDVSAAVYGSHVYRRFSPAVLSAIMADQGSAAEIARAVSPENPAWDSDVAPVAVPPRFVLRLADVDAGSSTPSMVKQVLQWQKNCPQDAAALWSALDDANTRIRQLWDQLVAAERADAAAYNHAVDWCAVHSAGEWSAAPDLATSETHRLLAELVKATLRMRALQREMGDRSQVPIEPPKQTCLLDACMQVPGVCMAAVPGAGGYDAIFCVALDRAASDAVARLWSSWSEMSVGPLLANQASSGVRLLDTQAYPEIIARLR